MFVTACTIDTPYEALAEQCRDVWAKLGITVRVVRYRTRGNWTLNNLEVPECIGKVWDGSGPVVWMDSEIRPNAFYPGEECALALQAIHDGEADVSCEFRPDQPEYQTVSTGIVHFSGSDAALKLFEDWRRECREADMSEPVVQKGADQLMLWRLLKDREGINWKRLEDGTNQRYERHTDTSAYISHFLHIPASHKYKGVAHGNG